jgi:hypothetical protein
MWQWIKTLDRILRGQATQSTDLREGGFDVPIFGLAVVIEMLGIIYGLCMGLFSVTPGGNGHPIQILATMLKTPALFLSTLVVTFPSLYVFNALVGSRLLVLSVLRLLIASLAVMLAVLASIGPIVAFFSFTTISYEFMVLLNVFVFAIAGLLGLAFLLQTLHRMSITIITSPPALNPNVPDRDENQSEPSETITPGPLDHSSEHVLAPHVKTVFRIWVIVFGLVGCQMAWVLRPFIGHPGEPFTWFRHPHSNFFQAVAGAAIKLFY